MSTPSITPQAIGAAVILGLTNAEILLGRTLSPTKEKALEALVNGVVILGFLAHDALIRRGRAQVAAAQAYQSVPLPVAPAPEVPQDTSALAPVTEPPAAA